MSSWGLARVGQEGVPIMTRFGVTMFPSSLAGALSGVRGSWPSASAKTIIHAGTRLSPPHLMLIRDIGELLGLEEPAYVLEP